jgi:hypothetical protein
MANELERHQRQQAWVQSLSKSGTGIGPPPESPQSLPTSTTMVEFPPPAKLSPLVMSSLSDDVESARKANAAAFAIPQDQRDGDSPPTELTLQSNREGDDAVPSSHHRDNHSPAAEESKTTSAVFRSLYLKAAQVFPLAGQAADSQLPPHPEVSYHSIVSHQESIHSNLDAISPPPAGMAP